MSFHDSLNPEQKEVINCQSPPIRVIAGAGTGKTKTLVHKLVSLLEEGYSPDEILLLTFSRRAAKEMISRVTNHVSIHSGKIQGGTFHSFCYGFLKKYGMFKGIDPNFLILDEEDKNSMIGLAKSKLGEELTKKRLPKNITLAEIFSSAFNRQLSLEKLILKDYPIFNSVISNIQTIREEYNELKRKYNRLDFDDLLDYTRMILMEEEHLRISISNTYKYILVDEYQDTNRIQAHIACLLASIHERILIVGDDAQCIYGFRGSSVRNILDFPKIFPKTNQITLIKNYRSNQGILDLANEVLEGSLENTKKRLFSHITSDTITKPTLVELESVEEEAFFVSEKILEFLETDTQLSEIAVLFRAGYQSNFLELQLQAKGIPFIKYGGKKFLESAHIKDILAYLKLMVNQKDILSWTRVLSKLKQVGKKHLDRILVTLEKNEFQIDSFENIYRDYPFLPDEIKSQLVSLFQVLMEAKKNPSAAYAYEVAMNYYEPIFMEEYDDFEKRKSDFQSLKLLFDDESSLSGKIADLTLDPIQPTDSSKDTEEAIVLSTIHSAKGLEWKVVFILQCSEGSIPYGKIQTREELEEERRLFYVAITRAKKNLYLLTPMLSEHRKPTPKTRFLESLPKTKSLWSREIYKNLDTKVSTEDSDSGQKNDLFKGIQDYFLN
ncbi:MAG: ATP-dependent helicase [Leptospira sp.]|nr:ATP-dependent helicase [Leptospira sp.]